MYFPDHPSISAQVSGFTGLSPQLAAIIMLGSMATLVAVGALWPSSPTYDAANLRVRALCGRGRIAVVAGCVLQLISWKQTGQSLAYV